METITNDLSLYDKWPLKDVKVEDAGLAPYLSTKPLFVLHSGGRHEHQRFRKSKLNFVERLINNLMRRGHHPKGGGKKMKASSIVKNAFTIINLKTKKNPLSIFIKAIENTAPCEEVTRIVYGGVAYPISVDISPQRRIDLSLRFISEGARQASKNNPKTIDECLSEEILYASERDSRSLAIKKRDEMERIALSSR